jgi:hypothetical protein
MNIIKFIESFTDDSLLQKGSRRESLSQFGNLGKKTALAAIPGGLISLLVIPQKSSAAIALSPFNDSTPLESLQLALMLEHLDSTFYQMGLDQNGLIPQGRDRTVFEKIVQNENAHKAAVIQGIQSLGGTPVMNQQFDFTAGGMFDPFNNYDQFLILAQSFEDTGVRAYKGQAHNLMSNPDLLKTSLQIHSAEARQASEVRRLRGEKGWITGSFRGTNVPDANQPVYNGEELTMQMNFNTSTVNNGSAGPQIPATSGTEAFDEPLTRQQVLAIANMFIE